MKLPFQQIPIDPLVQAIELGIESIILFVGSSHDYHLVFFLPTILVKVYEIYLE